MSDDARQSLRSSHRQLRRKLTPEQQAQAASAVCAKIEELDIFVNAHHLAFYQACDGEIDPSSVVRSALHKGKTCYLPVVTNSESMVFGPFDQSTILQPNRWGIDEPPLPEVKISPADFDLVFVPLVAFDKHCSRLGMGKGFYDRAFSFKTAEPSSRPLLIGLAHECQRTDALPVNSWDVRLDAVITAEKIYRPDAALGRDLVLL